MLRLVSDENVADAIVEGVLQRLPGIDFVTLAEVGLLGIDDPAMLEWAAAEERILITHDRRTMTKYARERVNTGLPMPGVFILHDRLPIGRAIEEIVIIADCSTDDEWKGRVEFLPL